MYPLFFLKKKGFPNYKSTGCVWKLSQSRLDEDRARILMLLRFSFSKLSSFSFSMWKDARRSVTNSRPSADFEVDVDVIQASTRGWNVFSDSFLRQINFFFSKFHASLRTHRFCAVVSSSSFLDRIWESMDFDSEIHAFEKLTFMDFFFITLFSVNLEHLTTWFDSNFRTARVDYCFLRQHNRIDYFF